jgi:hypothetical protein
MQISSFFNLVLLRPVFQTKFFFFFDQDMALACFVENSAIRAFLLKVHIVWPFEFGSQTHSIQYNKLKARNILKQIFIGQSHPRNP